ncbi:hypothetical protein FRB99_002564 [Tulasnella sp. 403]|nr:hypothetical protein FRB99_002564 [Tulasnella sp. 403]
MELSSRQRGIILCGLWLATFLSALNSTLVATLISSIGSEFKSAHQASWLGTSFLLATSRFVAGLGGGGIFTTSSICVSDLYSMRDRSLAQGYSSIFTGLGLGLGGPLGGYISDRFGWRWAFLFQGKHCAHIHPILYLGYTLLELYYPWTEQIFMGSAEAN